MPSSQFQELFIAEQLSPFGDRRADVQSGIIAATLGNMFRAYVAGMAKKSFQPLSIEDFMLPAMPKNPGTADERKAAEIERQYQYMLAIQAVQNAVAAKDDTN